MPAGPSKSKVERPIKTLPKPAIWFSSGSLSVNPADQPAPSKTKSSGRPKGSAGRRRSSPEMEDEGVVNNAPMTRSRAGHARAVSGEEDDFIMVSVSPESSKGRKPRSQHAAASHNKPGEPSCGMTMAAEKLSLVEYGGMNHSSSTPVKHSQPPRLPQLDLASGFDAGTFDSPLRPLPGQSRSLKLDSSDDNNHHAEEADSRHSHFEPLSPPRRDRQEPFGTASKTFITRARSDSMRGEEGDGSSPDSVRQRQGSWIKRSKGTTNAPGAVDASPLNAFPSAGLGKFGEGSLFSPQRMGMQDGGRTRKLTNGSERSDMSSSPPPPDTPIQRGSHQIHKMRSSTGLSGIPQPRFASMRRPSVPLNSMSSSHSLSGLPKSKSGSGHTGPTCDADNSVFLSPASKTAWSSSKPIRPVEHGSTSRGLLSYGLDKPRPHSGTALDREYEADKEAEKIFGSGKKAISMSELRHGPSGSASGSLFQLNKENQVGMDSPLRPARHRRTGSHHGNQLLFAKPADRSSIPPASPFATITNRPHRKTMSVENDHSSVMPRSFGLKAGLADSAKGAIPSTLGGGYGLIPKSTSGSSRSSMESSISNTNTNLTSVTSATSLGFEDPPFFDDVKPLQAAFEASDSQRVSRKFRGRDSISSNSLKGQILEEAPEVEISVVTKPPLFAPQASRPGFLKRASSYANDRDKNTLFAETPGLGPIAGSGWPTAFGIDFSVARDSLGGASSSRTDRPSMPDTPVKKGSFDGTAAGKSMGRVSHSVSQPILNTQPLFSAVKAPPVPSHVVAPPLPKLVFNGGPPGYNVPPSPMVHAGTRPPLVTITTGSSPMSVDSPGVEEASPTVRVSNRAPFGTAATQMMPKEQESATKSQLVPGAPASVRMGLLRRLSSSAASASSEMSEDENTPTKIKGGEPDMLAAQRPSLLRSTTPTPAPKHGSHDTSLLAPEAAPIQKSALKAPALQHMHTAPTPARQSLPHFKPVKRINHRQSAPAPILDQDEDLFDKRFIALEPLGKGAFSQVIKAKSRETDKVYAIKKARGVFEGVKDRLRHLEEVDILRHLSRTQHRHVIAFVDAWEQNRQLFIQTELYLGTLAFFLEEYGRVVERLDEARAWKICREMADGLAYIHSQGVIHFDLKPDNVLIDETGCLKIGDFGMATRWPRISAEEILIGSGLGGEVGNASGISRLSDREGDRVYMAPEMLQGDFTAANDVFSFGLVVLEAATNICVPDGGSAWHAIRENDFSIIDFTFLSPALVDLITQCMRADPLERPTMANLITHPILERARRLGKDALAPEDDMFLPRVLADASPATAMATDVDVEMTG